MPSQVVRFGGPLRAIMVVQSIAALLLWSVERISRDTHFWISSQFIVGFSLSSVFLSDLLAFIRSPSRALPAPDVICVVSFTFHRVHMKLCYFFHHSRPTGQFSSSFSSSFILFFVSFKFFSKKEMRSCVHCVGYECYESIIITSNDDFGWVITELVNARIIPILNTAEYDE